MQSSIDSEQWRVRPLCSSSEAGPRTRRRRSERGYWYQMNCCRVGVAAEFPSRIVLVIPLWRDADELDGRYQNQCEESA